MGRAEKRVEPTRGERNCAWIETYCHIPEGQFVGQPVVLRDWQRAIVCGIYDTPTRRAIVSFGRKNAKTTLSALLALLHLVGPEARANSQLFSAAQSRDQAALLFHLATKIVRLSPDLRQYVSVRDAAKQLYCAELGTLYRALSADASTAYGLSPVFTVHDELGQVRGPRSELYEALETAAGAQQHPLSIIISTQAPTDADLLSLLIDDAASEADPKTKLWLYTADERLDPFGEEAMRAANPAFGDFLNAEEVRDQAESARRLPAREAAYRNLVLNQRINLTNPFISRAVWEACSGAVDPTAFAGPCWIGLDLSQTTDLTALVMVGRDAQGVWQVRGEYFAPEAGVHERAHRDRVPYDLWARQGHLTLTPGKVVDYGFVANRLAELCAAHPVKEIAFDRWGIKLLQSELNKLDKQLPLVEFGQGYRSMTPALQVLEGVLLEGQLRHGGQPVLTMCAANAVVMRDPAGNRKLAKDKSTGRIDGLVALAMALGRAAEATTGPKYDLFFV